MAVAPQITASIVVYKEDITTLQKCIASFVQSPFATTLYIIDNSPEDSISEQLDNPKIQYVFSGENVGFGKGHNQVIDLLKKNSSDFHLILNPDMAFDPKILESLVSELSKQKSSAVIAPKILFPYGTMQYTARKFPSFSEQCYRFLRIFPKKTQRQEYRDQDLNTLFYPDFIHGNFMLFKTADFLSLQGFDERFFMYMEDVDVCRRIQKLDKKVVYDPSVFAYHEFRKGSRKKLRLFLTHLNSMLKYYKKWGI